MTDQDKWLVNDADLEAEIYEIFSELIKSDIYFCHELWSALTNTLWVKGGKYASMSYRYAGGFIADIRDKGETYMDFYCCAPSGVVSNKIAKIMLDNGWSFTHD